MRHLRWPNSLKSRYGLLLILLVLITQLLSTLVFLHYVQRPRVNDAAHLLAAQAQMLNTILRSVPPQDRPRYVRQLNAQSAPPPGLEEPDSDGLRGFVRGFDLQRFVQQLRVRLPDDMDVRWEPSPARRFWFRIHIAGEAWWITLPNIQAESITGWGIALLLSLLLSIVALAVAWFTHRHFTRPLTRLVRAARALGRGDKPAPLALSGPREIVEVSMTFNQMLQGLSDLEEKRAVLLAGISHDIRTPLTKLRLAIAMTPGREAAEEDYQRYFDDIDGILQQFIEYARGESHEPMEKGDLNLLLSALAQDYAGLGIFFDLRLEPLPDFSWRRTSILRLCMNLMQNAAKYGVKELEVASWHHQGYAWIAISDRGPGIPADELHEITQPFNRGRRNMQLSGAGLGLAIAERIVAQHQGELRISNRERGGLEVVFTLRMR
ncbi:ATP-binding protein [Erwinia sp. 9145]|uniref:ATP-binding protein n=1 Tax=Erwinia sp. 9145 TaxID=1500895 RepID=UPI000558E09E|nr:ATP-binding protein [Erwinia sp. 9145]